MRARLPTLALGVLNFRARCSFCGSLCVRVSSEVFEGAPARVLRLTAYRCRDCKRHFGVPPYAIAGQSSADDLPRCPNCGHQKTTASTKDPASVLNRLVGRSGKRCLNCRQRFASTDRRQLLTNLVLLATALAGLALAVSLLRD